MGAIPGGQTEEMELLACGIPFVPWGADAELPGSHGPRYPGKSGGRRRSERQGSVSSPRREVKEQLRAKFYEDGTFWMPYDDWFPNAWNDICVCMHPMDYMRDVAGDAAS